MVDFIFYYIERKMKKTKKMNRCAVLYFIFLVFLQYIKFHKKHSILQKYQKIKCRTSHLMILSYFSLNIIEHKFNRSAFSHFTYLFLLLKNWLKGPFKHFSYLKPLSTPKDWLTCMFPTVGNRKQRRWPWPNISAAYVYSSSYSWRCSFE